MSVLGERIERHSRERGRDPALVVVGRRAPEHLTWAQLERESRLRAAPLAAAAGRLGRPVAIVRARATCDGLVELIGALRTRMPVLVTAERTPALELIATISLLTGLGHDVVDAGGRDLRERAPRRDPRPGRLPDEALLVPTGGSTGLPRLVVDRRMRRLAAQPGATRPSSRMNWVIGQTQLVLGPLHHAAALSFFLEGLADGNTLVIPRRFEAATVVRAMHGHGVEWLSLTPYHLAELLPTLSQCGLPPRLRAIVHTAAPCPPAVKEAWIDRVGAEQIFEMYAATEGIGVTVARGDEWLERPGTVGRGFLTDVRIADVHRGWLPPHAVGRVYMRAGGSRCFEVVSGPGPAHLDGFLTVGDLGWLDDEGFLFLTGRQAHRLQVGGETVDPEEVESLLRAHPAVADAAVVGVEHPRLGQDLAAVVRPLHRVDGSSLRRYVRERAGRAKVPSHVLFASELPYSEAGKLDRIAVSRMVDSALLRPATGRPPRSLPGGSVGPEA